MLMLMKSQTEAMRALAYVVAAAMDFAAQDRTRTERKRNQAFVDLMIPVVKGWCTETGIEVASLGVQVHGGMGFVEETGAAQYLRDARITTIYEGTTGIQANDLVGRKIAREGGATVKALAGRAEEVRRRARQVAQRRHPGAAKPLAAGVQAVAECVDFIVATRQGPERGVRRRGAVPQADGHRRRRLADGACGAGRREEAAGQ